jgi:hypothetical protein
MWLWEWLQRLLALLGFDFNAAVENGTAHVMARKNSPFAPFARIFPTQWQYFKLDELLGDSQDLAQMVFPWAGPCSKQGSTATGPAGERLFAIHVAPGESRHPNDQDSPEQKCQQWVLTLMQQYPGRCSPQPLPQLCHEAQSRFSGLSKRAFLRCVTKA